MNKNKFLMITSCLLLVGLVGCSGTDTSTTSTSTKPNETSVGSSTVTPPVGTSSEEDITTSSEDTPVTSDDDTPETSEDTPDSSEAQKVEPKGEKIEFSVSSLMENDQSKLNALMADDTNWTITESSGKYDFTAGAPAKSNCWTFDGKEEIKFFRKIENVQSPKAWTLDSSKQNSIINEGVSYTHRFKSNGSNNKVQITITAPALISIEAQSSTSGEIRTIEMKSVDSKTSMPEITGKTEMTDKLELCQYLINEPGSYHWGTTSNGYNVYYVSVHYLAAATPAA